MYRWEIYLSNFGRKSLGILDVEGKEDENLSL
jgi:hypothetical protein